MHKSGNDFTLIIDLEKNTIHEYKFLVDSRWKCAQNEPQIVSNAHTINNFVDLRTFEPFNPDIIEDQVEDDSDDYYGQILPSDELFNIEPLVLPTLLKSIPFSKV